MTLQERFEAKFLRGDDDECWEWLASKNPKTGYGQISVKISNGSFQPALVHRVSYELYIGEIPEGHSVDHKCRNKICVNPHHLQTLTEAEHALKDHNNAHKVMCKNGHEFTEENTYIVNGTGARQCKACRKAYGKQYFIDNPNYKKEWREKKCGQADRRLI